MSTTTTKTPRAPRVGGILGGDKSGARSRGVRPRGRSKSLITLAALLVLGFGLVTAYMVTSAGDKASVLVMGAGVAKGHVVEREVLIAQSVSGVPNAIPVDQVDDVVGNIATVDLVEGQIITASMVTSTPTPAQGQSVVGLSLDPTRAPSSGLVAGDVVDVIAVPLGQGDAQAKGAADALETPPVLATKATVYDVTGMATDGGQMLVTLLVEDKYANRVAAYSTSGQVAIVKVAAGGEE